MASGSSMLEIHKGNADLSRRSVAFVLHVLSFREFVNIETKNYFSKIPKIRKLIALLSASVPYQTNITKLAKAMETDRITLLNYLNALHRASILILARNKGRVYIALSKPDKIFLQNPNLLNLLHTDFNSGTLRETFFINQLLHHFEINLNTEGDFIVNNKYVFEVGGASKKIKQIAKIPHSYLAISDTQVGIKNKIPLWIFGWLG